MDKLVALCFLLALTTLTLVEVHGNGEWCKVDEDCNTDDSQRCQKFDLCEWGQCVCGEGKFWNGGGYGGCVTMRKVDESCNNGTQYCFSEGSTVDCTAGGICTCKLPFVVNSDKTACIVSGTPACKKYGESCTSSTECCGYSGFGTSTTCESNKCACPDHTKWWEAASTCVHETAMRDLTVDERCTAVFPSNMAVQNSAQRICAKDLTCRQCPEHLSSTSRSFCARDSFNSAPVIQMSMMTLLVTVCVTLWA